MVSACTPWINLLYRSNGAADCLRSVTVVLMAPCRPRKPKVDPTASTLSAGHHLMSAQTRSHRRAHLIDDTASAHLNKESDPGPFLPIECQVDERRDAYQINAGGRDVTTRDGDRLDGLVDGASPDGMNLDALLTPDDSGDGPGHRDRLGVARNFEHLTGPALAGHGLENLVNYILSRCGGSGCTVGSWNRAKAAANLSQRPLRSSEIF